MKILISGATGFIGRQVVKNLYNSINEIYVVTRKRKFAQDLLISFPNVRIIEFDYHKDSDFGIFPDFTFDCFLHLAWANLDDLQSNQHMTRELAAQQSLLQLIISKKLTELLR